MAITCLDPAGSATGGTQFVNSVTGAVTAQTSVTNGQPYAYQLSTGAGPAHAILRRTAVLAAAGRRMSDYVQFPVLPSTNTSVTLIGAIPSAGAPNLAVWLGSDGVLRLYSNGTLTLLKTGTAVLSVDTWYRISLSYTITSTTNWSAKVYIDGVLEFTATNADGTLSSAAPVDFIVQTLLSAGTNYLLYVSDIYVDDTTDQTDPGDWHVTNRKSTTNTTNGFDTTIGTGAVNERPVSTTNGKHQAATADVDQDYDIEALSAGDVDLTGATIGGSIPWIWAELSSLTGTPLGHIIHNGARLAGTWDPASANTPQLFTGPPVTSATYPQHANGKNIGTSSSQIAADTKLWDCGVVVAYIPVTAVTVTPGAVALTASTLAATPRVRPRPPVVALTTALLAPTPRARVLPSAVTLTASALASLPRVRTLPGALALTGAIQAPRPAIRPTVPVVALTFTPFVPTVLRRNTVTPDVAALALSLLAPTPRIRVLPGEVAAIVTLKEATPRVRVLPNAVAAALVLQAPSPRVRVFPPAVDTTLTALDPTVRRLNTVTPDVTALTLSPLDARSAVRTLPGTLSVLLSAQTARAQVHVLPSTTALTMTAHDPAIAINQHVTVTPDALALALTMLAARPAVRTLPTTLAAALSVQTARSQLRVFPPATTLTMSALAPVPTLRALPASVTLALAAQAPTPRVRVLPAAVSLLLAAYDPTAITDTATTVTPGVVALTMALLAPRVQARVKPGSVGLLTVVPVVTPALGMRPASVALVVTILAPSVAFSAGAELIFQGQVVLGDLLSALHSHALGDELGLAPSVVGDSLDSLTSHASTDVLDQAAVSLRTDGL